MKAPLKARRPTPEDVVAIAAGAAPQQPPAMRPSEGEHDAATTLNLRVRMSTVRAIEAAAKGQGATMKQVVARALVAAGIKVAAVDLEDGTPRRRG